MRVELWLAVHVIVIGCAAIEVGEFLRKLDDILQEKLSHPHTTNSSHLFKDLSAYSFNVRRLVSQFRLKRENIMDTARMLHETGHPMFVRNFSCEKVKTDFSLDETEYEELIHLMDQISSSLSGFYNACAENPNFQGVPLPDSEFSLEKLSSKLDEIFKNPENASIPKYKIFKAAEQYFYKLGKFTKTFKMGRDTIMKRAQELFQSGGPQFLKHYNPLRMQTALSMTPYEAATMNHIMEKINTRYELFLSACSKNPDFKSKPDFTSINAVHRYEGALKHILSNPSPDLAEDLFRQVKGLYHVLGYLRRYNIPHRTELLKALNNTFGTGCPSILEPLFENIKSSFGLDDKVARTFQDRLELLRRRFIQVQHNYLHPNTSLRF